MMKRIRTVHSRKELAKSLFSSLKLNVISYNKYLKDTVNGMSIHALLCNCHPLDREYFIGKVKFYELDKL